MKKRKLIRMMWSKDYKERFKAEYYQLKERREKLIIMLEKHKDGTLEFTPTCPIELLTRQRKCMTEYLNILEQRAEIEGIEL